MPAQTPTTLDSPTSSVEAVSVRIAVVTEVVSEEATEVVTEVTITEMVEDASTTAVEIS
jgi:hypothetical protein